MCSWKLVISIFSFKINELWLWNFGTSFICTFISWEENNSCIWCMRRRLVNYNGLVVTMIFSIKEIMSWPWKQFDLLLLSFTKTLWRRKCHEISSIEDFCATVESFRGFNVTRDHPGVLVQSVTILQLDIVGLACTEQPQSLLPLSFSRGDVHYVLAFLIA